MNVNSRFKLIRKNLKITQEEFAKKLDLNQTNITDIERGKVKVSIQILEKLHNHYNINTNWLITGAGNIYNTKTDDKSENDIPSIQESYYFPIDREKELKEQIEDLKHDKADLRKERDLLRNEINELKLRLQNCDPTQVK